MLIIFRIYFLRSAKIGYYSLNIKEEIAACAFKNLSFPLILKISYKNQKNSLSTASDFRLIFIKSLVFF